MVVVMMRLIKHKSFISWAKPNYLKPKVGDKISRLVYLIICSVI